MGHIRKKFLKTETETVPEKTTLVKKLQLNIIDNQELNSHVRPGEIETETFLFQFSRV